MANVNSISSNSYSSASSIYGTKNILSGLASGLDTETMIENSVSGYKTKITELQQQQEKLTWKQDAMRSITDKMIGMTESYTSYSSKTNLTSNSFFTKAVNTTAGGTYADKVSATGSSSSEILINSVKSLATAAKYTVDAKSLDLSGVMNTAGAAIDFSSAQTASTIAGSTLTLKIGSNTVDLTFDESDKYGSLEELAAGINSKLADITATSKKSGSVKAGDLVQAQLDGNTISFNYTGSDGDSPYISGVTGKLASTFGVSGGTLKDGIQSFTIDDPAALTEEQDMATYLSGKTVNVALDGTTKKITIGTLDSSSATSLGDQLKASLQKGIDDAFGKNRVTVGYGENGAGLDFSVAADSGSTLKVTSDVGEALGIGQYGVSNYLNTGRTLGDLFGDDYFAKVKGAGTDWTQDEDGQWFDENGDLIDEDGYLLNEDQSYVYETKAFELNGVKIGEFGRDTALENVISAINKNTDAGVNVSFSTLTSEFVFTARNTGAAETISFGDGLASDLFSPGASPSSIALDASFNRGVFAYADSEDSKMVAFNLGEGSHTLQDLIDAFNSNSSTPNIVYDKTTSSYRMEESDGTQLDMSRFGINGRTFSDLFAGAGGGSYERQEAGGVVFRTPGGGTFTQGTDAELSVNVNGRDLTMKRATNVIDMDGLSVTLKGTFNADETGATINKADAVSFTTKSDADTIIGGIRSFVDEYNAILKEVHDAYSTLPAEKSSSSHTKYEPLTDEDKEGMSESAIKSYEEKAKQGILFGDTDLSSLYDRLRSIVSTNAGDLTSIGITTTYSDGVTQISLNETKLREALESNPDKVRDIFTQTKEGGASTDGLMAKVKNTLDRYASKSIATPGILVRKAGTKLSSLSLMNNTMQTQINNLNTKIESWQTKMSSKIDYYTRQFTALEQLMNNMNSQSSALSSMMGY